MQVDAFQNLFGSPGRQLPNALFGDAWHAWAGIHEECEHPAWLASDDSEWVSNAHWTNIGMTVPEALYYLRAFRFNPDG